MEADISTLQKTGHFYFALTEPKRPGCGQTVLVLIRCAGRFSRTGLNGAGGGVHERSR